MRNKIKVLLRGASQMIAAHPVISLVSTAFVISTACYLALRFLGVGNAPAQIIGLVIYSFFILPIDALLDGPSKDRHTSS